MLSPPKGALAVLRGDAEMDDTGLCGPFLLRHSARFSPMSMCPSQTSGF